jgi:hypothetical protein
MPLVPTLAAATKLLKPAEKILHSQTVQISTTTTALNRSQTELDFAQRFFSAKAKYLGSTSSMEKITFLEKRRPEVRNSMLKRSLVMLLLNIFC